MSDPRQAKGFTLVEIMVAMVVLAVGLLGMAAMTVLVMRGNRGAGSLTSATNICQLKMEALKDQNWDDLGNWEDPPFNDPADRIKWGPTDGDLSQEADLNAEGKDAEQVCADLASDECNLITDCSVVDDWKTVGTCATAVNDRGPYKFTRTFVVCRGEDYTVNGSDLDPPSGADDTNMVSAGANQRPSTPDCDVTEVYNTRTRALTCFEEDITSQSSKDSEKKLKVLCTWRDSGGQCHSVSLATTVVNLNPN